MKLLKKIFVNIGIFLLIVLILFVIAEVVARGFSTQTKGGPTAINLQIFEDSEIYGWGHHPGAVDYHGYGNPTPEVRINSHGFRDEEVADEKPEHTNRILVLGDSFTFGMNVRQEEIFTEVLEDNLKIRSDAIYEVINTGSIGYSTDNQYLLLKEKGLALQPDTVIVAFFVGNDVTEQRRHEIVKSSDGKLERIIDTKHYVDEDNRLRYKGEDEPWSYFLNFVYKRWLILEQKLGLKDDSAGPTLTWPAFLEPDDPHGDPRLPQFWNQIENVFAEMKADLDSRGIKLVVVAIPMDVQTSSRYWDKYSQMYFDEDAYEKNRPQLELAEICNDLEIDLIDLLPYFRMVSNDTWYYYEKDDPHWTPEGHKFAAEIIYNELFNEQNEDN